MDDKEKEKLSLAMYNIVLSIRDNVTLPTHGTIAKKKFTPSGSIPFYVIVVIFIMVKAGFEFYKDCSI